MLYMLIAALLLSPMGFAQVLVDANRAADLLRQFKPQPDAPLTCELTATAPAMTFSLRFQAGYSARVPLNQFRGPGHWIAVLIRVTPRFFNKQPVYLLRTFELPDVPDTTLDADVAGAFFVGEGKYQANAILFDDLHRTCRADWQIDVKSTTSSVILTPPDSVAPISDAAAWTSTVDAPLNRLTIFLHAAPLDPSSLKLPASDVMVAVSSLIGLLERLPARSIRLVVFSLLKGKEVYRSENFSINDLEQLTRVLDGLPLTTVDYQSLAQSSEKRSLLANLIRREVEEPDHAGAVVVLGPDAFYPSDLPKSSRGWTDSRRRFFYLQYRMTAPDSYQIESSPNGTARDPHPQPPCQVISLEGGCAPPSASQELSIAAPAASRNGSDPYGIASAVRKLKGQIFEVRNAQDFAKAVDRISKLTREH